MCAAFNPNFLHPIDWSSIVPKSLNECPEGKEFQAVNFPNECKLIVGSKQRGMLVPLEVVHNALQHNHDSSGTSFITPSQIFSRNLRVTLPCL
ncbi:hypothetical protein CDAR_3541 [Caerostris darwini]|uniref:Uncharacterized protein n=1 Tax=Caerostris darwini TaxID=1538125 RepID=A0AAV4PIJ9_9ARAC|nr:hypothetical protein CDAR_3541 [Caerostris darwini]